MNKKYVVKKGETLWGISKKIYGAGELYHIIAKENKISNPDTIQNGQIIKIPDVEFYTEKEVLEEAEKFGEYKKENERLNNIIEELKWKPIEEYDKSNYDWVLVKYFDGDYECVPCVAEKRFGKWYSIDEKEIQFDVKYFMDMQQLDKLKKIKGE